MPHLQYLPGQMGTAELAPQGCFETGSLAELTLTYTAGTFGIDDSGHLKITWRGTSDMAKPQFRDPAGLNYTTVEASNGAVLEVRVDRVNIRPWVNTLFIRVNRGFLRQGDRIVVRFGDRRQGSPGLRLQTNCEPTFEFKVFVDAFATYEFTELPSSPEIELVAGPAAPLESNLSHAGGGERTLPPRAGRRGYLGQSHRSCRDRSASVVVCHDRGVTGSRDGTARGWSRGVRIRCA